MTRITKAVLEQQVADMAAKIEQLEADLAHAKLTCQHAADALAAADAELAAVRTPSRRVAAAMPAWQAQRAASMALAREMAMRSGRSVKVAA